MDQKNTERRLIRIAVLLFAVSIILVAIALTKISSLFVKILLIVLAAIPVLIGAFLIYIILLAKSYQKGEHNFFLYDRKIRKNRPIEELTFAHVSNCVARYMTLFKSGKQLYLATLFEEGGAPEAFKPLFCYQLLGMLTSNPNDAQWRAFLLCGKELADAFSTYLNQADEEELARMVQYYIAEFDGQNVSPFRDYLSQKKDYLADRMLEYACTHIREFD